jgi:hypothetical protein
MQRQAKGQQKTQQPTIDRNIEGGRWFVTSAAGINKGGGQLQHEEEGLLMSDKESSSDGDGEIEAKWRQKLEATTNHSKQYEEEPGDNSQQEVA